MSDLLAGVVSTLESWRAPSTEQDALRAAYVEHLRTHPDGLFRACYPDHLTASALVLSHDRRMVLLTLHRKAGRWFQFGGHLEPDDDTLAGAARREALEESGLTSLGLDPDPVHLDVHAVPFCDPRGQARHLDVRFRLLASSKATPVRSGESLDVGWWPWDALPSDEPSLHELVRLARARP